MPNKNLEQAVFEMIKKRLNIDYVLYDGYDFDSNIYEVDDESGFQLDSVDSLEVVVGISTEFGVVVNEEDFSKLTSITNIARYIEEKQNDR